MKFVKIVLPVSIIALTGGYFFAKVQANKARQPRALTLFGNVNIRQVSLGFRSGGEVTVMHFEEGDPVAAGSVLAELDKRRTMPEHSEIRQRHDCDPLARPSRSPKKVRERKTSP